MLLFALHLAQQFVAALGFGDEGGGAQNAGDGARAGFLVGDLQQVVSEGQALDVVERAGVDGHARVILPAQQLEELLQGDRFFDGEDLGARGHDFADQHVAELDGAADKVAVALLEDALFFAGLDKGFDIDSGLLFGGGGLLGQRCDGEEKSDEDGDGRNQPEQQANGPEQARRPQAPRAVEKQRGNELVGEDDDQHHGKNGLGDLKRGGRAGVRGPDEEKRAEPESDEAERELLENGGAKIGVLAAEAEVGLDALLPRVEVLLHLAAEDLAELRVDALDVRGQRGHGDEENEEGERERGHGVRLLVLADPALERSMRPCGRPSRARKLRSRRRILPESVSWS